MAAFAATEDLVPDDVCSHVAESFKGVEHRLETVRVLHGVKYINDSIGSSPSRTIAGLKAMTVKPIVLCGGYDKHIPFDELGEEISKNVKHVFLTGDTAEKIRNAIIASPYYADSGLAVTMEEDFDSAVKRAASVARDGDTVLLSPACASFDHFKNFAERGNRFKKIVLELE